VIGIQAIGAVTAGGHDAPNTMAALISELQLFDGLDVPGSDGDPLTGARTGLPKRLKGVARLGGIGLLALTECAAKAPAGTRAPVLICSPTADDVGADPGVLLDAVTADAALLVDKARSRVFASGRAAFAQALSHADTLLRTGAVPACYLIGVDSLTESRRVTRLWEERRVFDPANRDGFVPGEAGVCVLLTGRVDERSLAAVTGFGTAEEPDEDVVTGAALSRAIAAAIRAAGIEPPAVGALVHDASGDRRSAEELTLASQREPFNRLGEVRVCAPADCTGEIGAAAGPLSLAMAAFFSAEGVDGFESAPALLACLAEGPARASVVVVPAELVRAQRRLRSTR
jgi:3-oxoacyl-[acyl-carrier-protein] synthase-1